MNGQPTPPPSSGPHTPGWWRRRSRRTRIALSIASIGLGLIIVAIPFAPWIIFHLVRPDPVLPYASRLASNTELLPEVKNRQDNANLPTPDDDRLVIPKIGVDNAIVEGRDERALWRGIWRFPASSTPDRGGNTVLTGHRFQYLAGPRTLYLLDQMQVGDVIIVYWKGQEYDYRIAERKIVNPDAVEILDDTSDPRLTIFTCTPVFSTKQRLVLIATPITT